MLVLSLGRKRRGIRRLRRNIEHTGKILLHSQTYIMFKILHIINKLKTVIRFPYKPYLLSGHIYNKLEKNHCNPDKYGIYNSTEDAMDACSVDSNCQAVYDQHCDESLNNVYLCPIGSSYINAPSSCIYEKQGIS